MSIRGKIGKLVVYCLWLLAGAGLVVLLVAAMNSRKEETCSGINIRINGKSEGTWFVSEKEIKQALTGDSRNRIKGRPVKSFNLELLESRLEKEVWVRDAELYFDNAGVLRVKVEEREPVARIFTTMSGSFYIDSSGHKLPLSDRLSVKLPVFTGFPGDDGKVRSPREKKLIGEIISLSGYLAKDPFWSAQISQVDITPSFRFEMVPTVGTHVIEFGDGGAIEEKFNKLMIFYRQVLAKGGMEKYERIKVQFDRQVIGVKKNTNHN